MNTLQTYAEPISAEPISAEAISAEANSAEPNSAEANSVEPTSTEPTSAEATFAEAIGDGLESFSAMLRAALGDLLAPGAASFAEMMAADAVMEFPFAPAGSVTRIEGRAALERYLSGFGEILQIDHMTAPTVHRSQRAGVVILEFGCVGSGVQTGAPYRQTYISVITLRDGRIMHYRDYWNPLVVLAAVGGADAVNAAIRAEEKG